MQGLWKKVGAALGSAVMIGATLAGAALAQTKTLGDYKNLMIASDGSVTGMYVVGANAATADVITAMGMTAWLGNQQVSGSSSGTGQITLTPLETTVKGVKRHIALDDTGNNAYEFSSSTNKEVIGPSGYASGDGVVDFLHSYKDNGPIYVNGTEYNWHEEVALYLNKLNVTRDTLETNAADQYDDIFLKVGRNSMNYTFKIDSGAISNSDIKGKKIWFMGKQYTVISVSNDIVKLGSVDSEVVLTTSNPTTTINGVDVTLGGIYSAGTSGSYKAKVTVTNGGTTETKYVTSGSTETIAGVEVYVKNAVVTTIGTNEGEAQMVVGAGVLKLENDANLKKGDGTETTWTIRKVPSDKVRLQALYVTESQSYESIGGDYPVLKIGDSISAPNGLFSLKFNGLTDQYGSPVTYKPIDIRPDSFKNSNLTKIETTSGDYIQFTVGGSTRTDNTIWVNLTAGANDAFIYKNTTGTTTTYEPITSPAIKLTTSDSLTLSYTTNGTNGGMLNITEPGTNKVLHIQQHGQKFQYKNGTVTKQTSYVDYDGFNTSSSWIARTSDYTTATRDYYTKYGIYVSSVGPYGITLKAPEGRTYGEILFGSESSGTGEAKTVSPGETVTIGGTKIKVEGTVSGQKPVTLPSTIAKLDTDVTSADEAAYNLVLIGGPAVNTLVNKLQTEGKLEKTIGSPGSNADVAAAGAGVIELVDDAWGTGKYAIVVAGSDRAGTNKAGNILAHFDDHASDLTGKTAYMV